MNALWYSSTLLLYMHLCKSAQGAMVNVNVVGVMTAKLCLAVLVEGYTWTPPIHLVRFSPDHFY